MKCLMMSSIICMEIFPIDRISKYGLESHSFIQGPVAVNELAPHLVIWRCNSGEVCTSSSTVCMNVNEEGGGNISSHSMGIIEPVVMVPVLTSNSVILNDNRHEVTERLVKW